jgi:hypothetical protein
MQVLVKSSKPVVSKETAKGRQHSHQSIIGLLQDGTEVYGLISGFTAGINNEKSGVDFEMFEKVAAGAVIEMQSQGEVTDKNGETRLSYIFRYANNLGESPYTEKADVSAISAFLAKGLKPAAQEAAAKEVTKVTSKTRR